MDTTQETPMLFPISPIVSYLRRLKETKPGLPHGHPICVSASPAISTTAALVRLANQVGPHIAVFQVQADIIDDWSANTAQQLTSLAKKYGFLLWEGRYLVVGQDLAGLSPSEARLQRRDQVETVKRQYTRGVVSIASWASLATFWPCSAPAREQESDIVISALRSGARETVTKIAQVIRTEITAEKNLAGEENTEESVAIESTLLLPIELSSNTLELPTRRISTISLTHSIVQRSEPSPTFLATDANRSESESLDQDAQWLKPPSQFPVLSRGLLLGLPRQGRDAFSAAWYRDSCLAAGRANRDFIVGFYCLDSWLEVSRWHDVLQPRQTEDKEETSATVATFDERDRLFVIFSRLPYDTWRIRAMHLNPVNDEEEELADPDGPNTEARLLHIIMEQAINSIKEAEDGDGSPKSVDPGLLHVPIITLG
ncbi:hypothetical protein BGW36DRAFT_358569 [Talaromyces proteolyticus]|uniref:Uncharacterized protein n=1 Tax=Talaromyces proteolyticus TaxID=1131652 RepID=A0AAD4Q205_9EURO|nr:uncharacterized protein BGW36DRAFT_358569 [Talaromyces proteolyticus]KAH8699060.1 hypothetical protein BGW36DRAFT_358569 [Talaromyces proteolyticus]